MKKGDAPRPTGKVKKDLNLEGLLLLWRGDQPVLIVIDGADSWCLPIFSTKGNLDYAAEVFGLEYETIKQVAGPDFCDSAWAGGIRIVLDPYKTERGTVRYLEVCPSPKDPS
jgi:hypothetical protein